MIRLSFILCLIACGNKEQSDTSQDTGIVEDTTPMNEGGMDMTL